MEITPNIKNMAVYSFLSGLFIWALFGIFLSDNYDLTLLAAIALIILINAIRLSLLKQKNINIENNQLFIEGTLVSVSYKYKWLAFIWLDSITYESSPWKKNVRGSLDHYMFSKEQWSLLKSAAT
jgi:hypothetical protein